MHGEAEILCKIKCHVIIDLMRLCTSTMRHWRVTPGESDSGASG